MHKIPSVIEEKICLKLKNYKWYVINYMLDFLGTQNFRNSLIAINIIELSALHVNKFEWVFTPCCFSSNRHPQEEFLPRQQANTLLLYLSSQQVMVSGNSVKRISWFFKEFPGFFSRRISYYVILVEWSSIYNVNWLGISLLSEGLNK